MQIHTDAYTSHGELAYASLEECSAEVVCSEVVCLLKEAVCLVRIAEVGRRTYHIVHLLSEKRKTC